MGRQKKLIYVVSDTGARDKIYAYFWYASYFQKRGYDLSFIILNGNHSLRSFLSEKKIKYTVLNYTGKNKWDLLTSFFRMWLLFLFQRPQIVHTHYFDANFIGLAAARMAGINGRIYSRHHGSLSHSINPRAVQLDKKISAMAKKIIAVSEIVKKILVELEGADPRKIEVIHHGFDFSDAEQPEKERVEKIMLRYGIPRNKKIIGVVSSFQKLKGIQYIIEAFKSCLSKRDDIFLVLANAHGIDETEIRRQLKQLPAGSYCEIVYENDIFSLFKTFDVFVHIPVDPQMEAFGQVYVEALMCRVPSVFTLSGIAPEFIIHERNALVVDFKNPRQTEEAILLLLENKELSARIAENGFLDVKEKFSVEQMIDKMDQLYQSVS